MTVDWVAISAVATAGAAIATGVLAWLTRRLVVKTGDAVAAAQRDIDLTAQAVTAATASADAAREQTALLADQAANTRRQVELTAVALQASREPLIVDAPDPTRNRVQVNANPLAREWIVAIDIRNAGTGPALLTRAAHSPTPGLSRDLPQLPALVVVAGDEIRLTWTSSDPTLDDEAIVSALDQGTTSCWIHYNSLASPTRYRTRLDLKRPPHPNAVWTVIGVSIFHDDDTTPTATAGTPHRL